MRAANNAQEQPKSPGRPSEPEEGKIYFKIGQQVEKEIPKDRKQQRSAIVAARQLISQKTGRLYDIVAEYHRNYRQALDMGPRNLGRKSL